jgi:hypothetical protein
VICFHRDFCPDPANGLELERGMAGPFRWKVPVAYIPDGDSYRLGVSRIITLELSRAEGLREH